MILTAPWGVFLLFFPVLLGITGETIHNNDVLFFSVEMVIGTLINSSILYLLGYLATKAFNYLSSK